MSSLLIPVAPLSKTKSRLRDCFSVDQLKDFTIAMFTDLCNKLEEVECFKHKIVYSNAKEILELAKDYGLIGIKEELSNPPKTFDEIITDFNNIACDKYRSEQTVLAFLDLILISARDFIEIDTQISYHNLVVCPAIHSAGISILARNPPNVIRSSFSDPTVLSLVALLNNASEKGIKRVYIYDSFRAGFDIDIKQDLLVGYEYLKIFNLTHTEVYKFLRNNLKLSLKKKNADNNRNFEIIKEK
jgi:2-phospho-L-lactate guanylyltransferase (CobY/MobA/RfbA family)